MLLERRAIARNGRVLATFAFVQHRLVVIQCYGAARGQPAAVQRAGELGSGFLYGISRLGVTGARDRVASGAQELVRRIRAQTTLPIALGFGISRPEHVTEVCTYADAAVVGSAFVVAAGIGAERSGARAPAEPAPVGSACG